MIKSGQMVLKVVNRFTMIKLGQMILKEVQESAHMVLKGINWTQYKNWFKWS